MRPLEGVKVLACEQWEAGTSATMPMAFMGAEVLLVEQPGKGQIGRYALGGKPGIDGWYHVYLTMNKKSITLNLQNPKGVEMFKEMAKKVDIVHENMAPGTMDKLGVGFSVLRQVNPKLILSTLKGFGAGPYEKFLCMDGVAQAVGTSFSMTGWPDKPPKTPGPSLGDTGTGMFSFCAMMAALYQRDITGEGQNVEVAMADCSLNYNRANLALRQAEKDPMFQGKAVERFGNSLPGVAPYNIYKTTDTGDKDNYIAIFVREPKQWDALLRVIGRTDLIGDQRFKDPNTRWDNAAEVDKIIEDWTSKRTAKESFELLAGAGVPAGITQNSTQVMSDPHFIDRQMVAELDHPLRGRFKILGAVPRLSENTFTYTYGPLLGQHNAEIYGKYLGLTHIELAKLQAEGVI